MKRITAWILTLACFLGCRMAMPAYAEADVPALEPGSVVEDVVLKEVFTFTDKAGNVSEPQVLCSWDYDSFGRVTRRVDETGNPRLDNGKKYYTHSFAASPLPDEDPLELGTLREYTYDGLGNLCLITYYKTEYGVEKISRGVPVLDEDGRMLSQTIDSNGVTYEVGYFYNEDGTLGRMSAFTEDDDGKHHFDCYYFYDEYGLLVKETGRYYGTYYYYMPGYYSPYDYEGDSWEKTYAYDEMGRLTSGTFTYFDWTSDMANFWIEYQTTDRYTFSYEADRLTKVTVECGDTVDYQGGSEYYGGQPVLETAFESYTVNIVYGNYYIQPVDPDPDNGLVLYTDTNSLSIRSTGMITLGAGILRDGELTEDHSGITFQIEDNSVLTPVYTSAVDRVLYFRLQALKEGFTYVTVTDSVTGEYTRLPITVFENEYLSYTLSAVPVEYIDKYPTNIYNASGLFVDSYTYRVLEDGTADVSFEVYNTNHSYGAVEVFYEDGTLHSLDLINKMNTGNTSLKEVVIDNTWCMVRDAALGNLLSYRQETGYSKRTKVSVNIPAGGYLRITMDPRASNAVYLLNYADILMSLTALGQEGATFDSKAYSEELSRQLVSKNFAGLFNTKIKVAKRLWDEVGRDCTVNNLESMFGYMEKASETFSETEVEKIVVNSAFNIGCDTAEDTLAKMMGPAGVAMKGVFLMGKAQALVLQAYDFVHSADAGGIYIFNQSGGIRSCREIKVECQSGLSDDTTLSVYQVTLDEEVLENVKKVNKKLYRSLKEETTHTYNISLLRRGNEVQPDGKVTVYIPIPEGLEALAYAGKLTVVRVEENGNYTQMDVSVDSGCLTFTTDHFSLYAVVEYEAEDTDSRETDDSSFGIWIFAAAAIALLAAGGAVALVLKKKKAK